MKRLFFIAIISVLSCHLSFSQSGDTIFGRNPNYHYYGWYDGCFRYQDEDNDFTLRHFYSRSALAGDAYANQVLVEEQYSPGTLEIKGVAVMVAIAPGEDSLLNLYMPSTDSLKMPEYVYLYQGGPTVPGLPDYYYPHQLTLLDSVRWDTAAPTVMALPSNAAGDSMLYCHVYEAFFDSTIFVEDTFYILGTYRSNLFDYVEDTVYDEYDSTSYYLNRACHYRHFPTDYVVVWDHFSDQCNKCAVEDRLFFCYYPPQEEVMEVYNWLWFMAGPFLPIVNRSNE